MIRTANEGIALTPSQVAKLMLAAEIPAEYQEKIQAVRHKIAVLDAFSGENSSVVYAGNTDQMQRFIDTVQDTYDKLASNVYESLLFQTRLQPYLNEIGLTLENGEFKLDYSGIEAKFNAVYSENPEKAFVDLGEFLAYGKSGAEELNSLFAGYVETAAQNGTFSNYAAALGSEAFTKLGHQLGTGKDETLSGNQTANYLAGRDETTDFMVMAVTTY
ncbi:hypothetical protein C7N83_00075 [Neisseria iguanae]|uniref:Uncharacterized protein n=1 Tax=Neisseria iguanae TaxID=90242 RepID=A0A2P7U399_9NEIS|nr:hypothetical protein [Neisseria iguanae]PSJ81462.1 hypothetical protein C7N83_00075 [Neisseria iguanae]